MKSTIAKIVTPVLATLFNILPFSTVIAIEDVCNTDASDQVKAASGCPGYGTDDNLPNVIIIILNSIIGVASFISVIWIIIGGVNYMTSSGDATKVKKARDTILYACIGLAICFLSFAIVNFVIVNILEAN